MLEKGFSVPELAVPALPQGFAWFPLPPGWWITGAVVLIALLLFCCSVWRAGGAMRGVGKHWPRCNMRTASTAGLN